MRIELGGNMKIPTDGKFHPEAGHIGKCVWISEDGKTAALQCEKSHKGKTMVFIVKINSGD